MGAKGRAAALAGVLAALAVGGWSGRAAAQEPRASNAVYLEGLGAGVLYSVNYERLVAGDGIALRVGVSTLPLWTSSSSRGPAFVVPVTASILGPGRGSGIELGGGATFGTDLHGDGGVLGTVLCGVRHQPAAAGGFQFRAGGQFFVGRFFDVSAVPWVYLSVGRTF